MLIEIVAGTKVAVSLCAEDLGDTEDHRAKEVALDQEVREAVQDQWDPADRRDVKEKGVNVDCGVVRDQEVR